jgi:hypothetical protein
MALINAYKLKKHIQESELKSQDNSSTYMIKTLDPIIFPPEKKFDHKKGALIAPFPFSPGKLYEV